MSAEAYIPDAIAGSYPIRDGNRVLPMVGAGMFFCAFAMPSMPRATAFG